MIPQSVVGSVVVVKYV